MNMLDYDDNILFQLGIFKNHLLSFISKVLNVTGGWGREQTKQHKQTKTQRNPIYPQLHVEPSTTKEIQETFSRKSFAELIYWLINKYL